MSNKRHSSKRLAIVLLTILAAILVITVLSSAILESKGLLNLNLPMPSGNLRGILQALVSLVTIIMICIDYKRSKPIVCILQGSSLVFMLMSVVRSGDVTVLPGIVNTILSLATVLLICHHLRTSEKASFTDDITKLYNRYGFITHTEQRIDSNKLSYIAFIQITNFRNINDNLGHVYGDLALQIISQRISDIVGKNALVARLDGTLFAVAFCPNANISKYCNEIYESLNRRITLEKDNICVNSYLDACIGVAAYPNDAKDIDTLMKFASIALHKAAHSTNDKICYFDNSLARESEERDQIQRCVKDSIENDYFHLVYQPQFNIEDKKLRGFETLLRCTLPTGDRLSPAVFIPIAEKSDLIMSIDNYVLKRAMTEFRPILQQSPTFVLSINVSAKSMSSADFVFRLKNLLHEVNFPPSHLEIEITEYSFSESREQTIRNVMALREMDVMIALDDFGTGYTSLEQLLKLPINLLKIDKSLIDDIESSQVNRDFIDSVIYMGHLIGCEVISEGVEDEKQLDKLRSLKCDYVQGYVWGKPLSFSDAVTVVREGCAR